MDNEKLHNNCEKITTLKGISKSKSSNSTSHLDLGNSHSRKINLRNSNSKNSDFGKNQNNYKKKSGKKSYNSGFFAEKYARTILILKGYKILSDRNAGVRGSEFGEIDIIAKRGDFICFIEVKKRKTYVDACEAISFRQQARIAKSAELWIAKNPEIVTGNLNINYRFDAILVYGAAPLLKIKHIKSAWMA